MAKLTYHGHATCGIELDDGTNIVIDPFFGDNPACGITVDEVEADYILVTHGHGDHIGDLIPLARRTGAQVISTYEIVSWLATLGIDHAHPLHIGGGFTFPFGYVKMTPALAPTESAMTAYTPSLTGCSRKSRLGVTSSAKGILLQATAAISTE